MANADKNTDTVHSSSIDTPFPSPNVQQFIEEEQKKFTRLLTFDAWHPVGKLNSIEVTWRNAAESILDRVVARRLLGAVWEQHGDVAGLRQTHAGIRIEYENMRGFVIQNVEQRFNVTSRSETHKHRDADEYIRSQASRTA